MITQPKFLEQIAAYYIDSDRDMSGYTFVFPNKRSAMFLKKYMQERASRRSSTPLFMPRFVTMGRLMSRFAAVPEMDRREQLFLLYDCYRRVLARLGREEQVRDFDRFIFWGEIILDDFDDIDRQLVNAGKLFDNLRDIKEITANYLDDEQKKIARQLWGDSPLTTSVADFWLHVGHENESETTDSFISLWQLLGSLYDEFRSALADRELETSGGQYRLAASRIAEMSFDELQRTKYAFIGFNDFSHSETLVLKRLKDVGAAEFFWDFASPWFSETLDRGLYNRLNALTRNFPAPDDFTLAAIETAPEIEIMAVPSNIAQAKTVTPILENWASQGLVSQVNAINTAVVVPDENLLMPVLVSVPDSIPAINITMGVSYRLTPFASLLRSIISMQMRSREVRGAVHYYYADVSEVLSHPHIAVIAPDHAEAVRSYISRERLYNLPAESLVTRCPELAYIFTPVKSQTDPQSISEYLTRLVDSLSEALSTVRHNSQDGLPEIEMLRYIRSQLDDIASLVDRYKVAMNENTYFTLFERLLDARRIDLQGTPLKGLQIMGVLETRSIDFDNIIILSVNENSLPRKSYMRTMIPNSLRIGFGMSTIDRQDSLYTYYFYRLIARAKNVKLLYDARNTSLGAGEPSRYISQLRHLGQSDRIKFTTLTAGANLADPPEVTVAKTPEVIESLRCFRPGGNASLSASALKSYKKCRLQFYLQYVRRMRGDEAPADYMSASVYGTIVHRTVELLYTPYVGKNIDTATIDAILADPALIADTIRRVIFEEYYRHHSPSLTDELPAEGAVTAYVIERHVRHMLELEKSTFCRPEFAFAGGEVKIDRPAWKLFDSEGVNFKMSIDRIDRLSDGSLRFIDYKSGSDRVAANYKYERLFEREKHEADAVFQILTYCEAYADMCGYEGAIEPVVLPFREMAVNDSISPVTVESEVVTDYHQVSREFRARLSALVAEIFDPDVPFNQAEDPRACKFCPFLNLCGRTVPEY